VNPFKWLFDKLVGWWWEFVEWCRQTGIDLVNDVLTFAQEYLPSLEYFEPVMDYAAQINYFVPLSETILMATAYFSLWAFITGYRWLKSWIPGV
jgi:hypothetical protein